MKKFAITFLLLAVFFIPATAKSSNGLDGQYINDSQLLSQYGDYAFKTLQKFPVLLVTIRKAKPDFQTRDIGTSFPTEVFQTNSGRKLIILGGCTPHNCGGTQNIILFDPQTNRAYVLRENRDQDDFQIFGNPPDNIRRVLEYHWRNR